MTAGPLRRLRGVVGDSVIVLAWAAIAAVVGVLLRATGTAPTTPTGWDLVAALTLVVPVAATHAVLEARSGATPGKRWAGGVVDRVDGGPLDLPTAAMRAAVKFAPWQVAHSAVFQLVGGSEDVVWLALAVGAQVVVVASVLMVVLRDDRRSLHDLAAGTRVVAGRPRAAGASGSGPGAMTP